MQEIQSSTRSIFVRNEVLKNEFIAELKSGMTARQFMEQNMEARDVTLVFNGKIIEGNQSLDSVKQNMTLTLRSETLVAGSRQPLLIDTNQGGQLQPADPDHDGGRNSLLCFLDKFRQSGAGTQVQPGDRTQPGGDQAGNRIFKYLRCCRKKSGRSDADGGRCAWLRCCKRSKCCKKSKYCQRLRCCKKSKYCQRFRCCKKKKVPPVDGIYEQRYGLKADAQISDIKEIELVASMTIGQITNQPSTSQPTDPAAAVNASGASQQQPSQLLNASGANQQQPSQPTNDANKNVHANQQQPSQPNVPLTLTGHKIVESFLVNPEGDNPHYHHYQGRYFTREQKFSIDYPLVAYNQGDTSTLFISYPQEIGSGNPTTMSVYTGGQLIAASGVLNSESQNPTFAMLTLSKNRLIHRLWMQIITLKKVHDKADWSKPANWERTIVELHHSGHSVIAPLSDAKNVSYQFMDVNGVFGVAVKTKSSVSWISTTGTVTVSTAGDQLDQNDLLRCGDYIYYNTCEVDNHLDKFLIVHRFDIKNPSQSEVVKKVEIDQALTCSITRDVITIIDNKAMCHTFRLGERGINSQSITHIDAVARDKHNLRREDLQVSENVLAFKSKLYFLDSGVEIINRNYSYPDREIYPHEALVLLHPSIMLHRLGETLTLRPNPGSRELISCSDRLWQNLKGIHQISNDTLLLECNSNEWISVTTDGDRKEVSQSLLDLLKQKNYQVQSINYLDRRCDLLLVEKTTSEVKEIKLVELDEAGDVASTTDYDFDQAVDQSSVTREEILFNQKGNLVHVRVGGPRLQGADPEIRITQGRLCLLEIDEANDRSIFVMLGHLICWTFEDKITIVDLKTGRSSTLKFDSNNITIAACNIHSLIESGELRFWEEKQIIQLMNYLHVRVENRILVYNVNVPEPKGKKKDDPKQAKLPLPDPVVVCDELDSLELMNPQKFVELGYMPSYNQWRVERSQLGNLVILRDNLSFRGLYKRYSKHDADVAMLIESGIRNIPISATQLFAQFEGKSPCMQDRKTLDAIYEDLMKQIESSKDQAYHDLIRIGAVLTNRYICDGQFKSTTPAQSSGNMLRDAVLRIASLCPNHSVLNCLLNQDDFKGMSSALTAADLEALNQCEKKTASMEDITCLKMPIDLPRMSYMSKTSTVLTDDLIDRATNLRPKSQQATVPVSIKYLDLRWMSEGSKNLPSFVNKLPTKLPEGLLQSQFMSQLFEHIWAPNRKKLLWRIVLPQFLLIVLSVAYFIHVLSDPEEDAQPGLASVDLAIGSIVQLLLVYFIWVELRKMCPCREYWRSIWNWINLITILLTQTIVATTIGQVPLFTLQNFRLLAAVTTGLLIFKLFNLFRICDTSNFYIQFIENVLSDIAPFIGLFFLAFLMIATPIGLVNMSRDPGSSLVQPYVNDELVDGIINQYMLLLGEFGSLTSVVADNNAETWFIIAFFFLATLLIKIAMFNMLIAVILSSYDRTVEGKKLYNIANKFSLIRSMAKNMRKKDKEQQEEVYLIIVERIEDKAEEDWDDSISKITATTRQVEARCQSISKELAEIRQGQQLVLSQLQGVSSGGNDAALMMSDLKSLVSSALAQSAAAASGGAGSAAATADPMASFRF